MKKRIRNPYRKKKRDYDFNERKSVAAYGTESSGLKGYAVVNLLGGEGNPREERYDFFF